MSLESRAEASSQRIGAELVGTYLRAEHADTHFSLVSLLPRPFLPHYIPICSGEADRLTVMPRCRLRVTRYVAFLSEHDVDFPSDTCVSSHSAHRIEDRSSGLYIMRRAVSLSFETFIDIDAHHRSIERLQGREKRDGVLLLSRRASRTYNRTADL